jgi:hypothetical protein
MRGLHRGIDGPGITWLRVDLGTHTSAAQSQHQGRTLVRSVCDAALAARRVGAKVTVKVQARRGSMRPSGAGDE